MSGDPYYNYTSLLLPMTGANNSTTFTDASPTPKTVAAGGNAKISTEQSQWGSGSGYFDGSGDYLVVPDSDDLSFGDRDFTVECWIRLPNYPPLNENTGAYGYALVSKEASLTNREWSLMLFGTATSLTALVFQGYPNAGNTTGGIVVSCNYSFSLNTFYHIEVCRRGNLMFFFVGGGLQNPGGTLFNININNGISPLLVGRLISPLYEYDLKGNIQDLRITRGIARHTADFTPPAAALPTFQDLTCNAVLLPPLLTCAPGAVSGPAAGVLLAEPTRRYDSEDGGRIYIAGQVTMGGSPVARKVRLHTLHNGRLIREAWSDPVTGAYRFDGLKDQPYYVWSEDYQRVYDPVSHLVPNLS